MSLATASIRARLIRSEIATSVGSTSMATRPALRIVSSWRCDELATRIAISLLVKTRTTSQSIGPSARISTPTAPRRRAASHASDKNGKGAVALDTTLGVTACGLDHECSSGTDGTSSETRFGRATGQARLRETIWTFWNDRDPGRPRPADPGLWCATRQFFFGSAAFVVGAGAVRSHSGASWSPPAWLVLLGGRRRSLGLADLLDVLLQDARARRRTTA